MKINKLLYVLATILLFSCDDNYIDDISSVDPGPDEAAPTVTVNYPLEGTELRVVSDVVPITISFQIDDDIEIGSVAVQLDGQEIATYNEFVDYRNFTVDDLVYQELTNGDHNLSVTAVDISGKSTTASVNFRKIEPYAPYDGEIFYMPFNGDYMELVTITTGTGKNTVFVEGIKGQAVSLDASFPSYVLFPSNTVTDPGSFSLSFWVNPDFIDSNSDNVIDGVLGLVNISNVNNFWGNLDFFVENGSTAEIAKMNIHIANGSSETWIGVDNIPDFFGQWTNHILTFDASTSLFNYYINGVLIASVPSEWNGPLIFKDSGPIVMGTVHFQTEPSLTTGSGSQSWASHLTGELDEVRMFNKALSQDEIDLILNDVD